MKTSDSVDSGDYSVISQKSALESFTIGGELDFTLDDTDASRKHSTPSEAIEKASVTTKAVQKKDDLMDALMAIDDVDDEDGDDDDAENENDAGIDKHRNALEKTEQNVVSEHLNSTMTEEIVFEDSSTPQHEEVVAESDTDVVEGEAAQEDLEDVAISINNKDSGDSSKDQNVINLDSLDLDDLDVNAQVKDGEDGFDFDSDDDDELADLEEFLMKASS